MRNLRRLMLLSMLIPLSGCGLLRSSPPTPPQLPTHWSMPSPATKEQTDFWASLGDADLPAVLAQALRQNDDIKLSALRAKLAQIQSSLSGLSRWPSDSLGFNAGVSRPMNSPEGFAPSTSRFAGGNFTLSYPLDIWGTAMAQREAAELDAQASENDWRAARLAICVAVAQTRWQLGYLHRLRTQAFADLHDARSTLELTQIRYRAGAISGGDQVFARQSVVSQQATLSQLEQQIVETRHAFALLMGAPPESPQPELDDLPDTVLPVPAAGLPVDLLSRRADVHAAELRVRSSLVDADATRLSFYPSLTLTGSYGTSSPTLTQYLANPIGQLAAALTLPFVQFNTARLSNQSARVAYEAESVSFRKTLYRALQETEDALSARVRLSEQAQYLNEALALTQEAERVTFSRWQLGRTDIQPWLDAKGARRRATLNLMQNTLARRNNAVQIYAALGGDYHQRQ